MKIRKVAFLSLFVVMSSTFMGCNNKAVNTQNVDQQSEIVKSGRLSAILPKEWTLQAIGKAEDGDPIIIYNRNLDRINISLNEEPKNGGDLNPLREALMPMENPNCEVTEIQQYPIGEGFTSISSDCIDEDLIKYHVEDLRAYTDKEAEQLKNKIGKMGYQIVTWIRVKQQRVSICAIGIDCDKDELIKIVQDIAENVQVEEENTDTNDK